MKKTVAAPTIIDINLLPGSRRPLDVSPAAAAVVVALMLCVVAMVPLSFRAHHARQAAADMEHKAEEAERSVNAMQLRLAGQRELYAEVEAAKAKLASLREQRERLQGGARPLDADLAALFGDGAVVPGGVRVTAIAGADRHLKVDGVAGDPLEAIAYAETLANSAGFRSAGLTAFSPAAGGGGIFSLEVGR